MKNNPKNKGITLIVLVITIIVILIVTGVTITASIDSYKQSLRSSFLAEMEIIKARVNISATEGVLINYGQNIPDEKTTLVNNIFSTLGGRNISEYKYFDKNDLRDIGAEIDMQVVVNLTTREVISLFGIEINGQMKYRTEDINYGTYNVQHVEKSIGTIDFETEVTTTVDESKNKTIVITAKNIVYSANTEGAELEYRQLGDVGFTKASGYSFNVYDIGVYELKLTGKDGAVKSRYQKVRDVSIANEPKISAGMTKIIYDETKAMWKEYKTGDVYYDYIAQPGKTETEGTSKWANMMLQDNIAFDTERYVTSLGSMFVWIPRYAYKITYYSDAASRDADIYNGVVDIDKILGYSDSRGIVNKSGAIATFSRAYGVIDVVFLDNLNYTYKNVLNQTINPTQNKDSYRFIVHPSFADGSKNNYANGGWDKELSGIWVGKFESSNNAGAVKVVPNVASWRSITVSNMFAECQKISGTNKTIYSLTNNESDAHMMKNIEWGAVAYLTQSNYGRNATEVTINNSSSYYTGRAGNSVSDSTYTANGTYTYETSGGKLASTTGNVYGIYDMSGGTYEYVAAYVNNGTLNLATHNSTLVAAGSKYKDVYAVGTTDNDQNNYLANASKKGDALYETSSIGNTDGGAWNTDYSRFPYANGPVFIRGMYYISGALRAGVFSFINFDGGANSSDGFRVSLSI